MTAAAAPTFHDKTRADYAAVAVGWARWEPHILAFSWPVTHRLLDALQLPRGAKVLDVGCGIGDPTVAVAQAVGPSGHVLATDLTPEMIDYARERLASLGVTNAELRTAAVESLDFPPASFDAIVGRWSLIFCEDVIGQLRRLRGWLRPGGRLAMSTWTPMENSPGFVAINRAVSARLHLPPPDPDKPGMQNLSRPGRLAEALREAGYADVGTDVVRLSFVARDGDEYWEMSRDMGATLRGALSRLPDDQTEQIGREVADSVEAFRAGPVLRIPSLAQVGWGCAP